MAEDREDHQEGDEKCRERDRKVGADHDRPGQHRPRIGHDRPHAGGHRRDEIDVAVDDQRRRNRGDRKDDERDDRPERIADQKETSSRNAVVKILANKCWQGRNVRAVEHQEHEDGQIEPDDEGEAD